MAILSPTTIFVAVLLLYLSSFVVFAIIRIATGVSIQRIGYLSLRRITYTPREGIQLDLRGLRLSLHRPSFAQPTWISLRFSDLKVTLDPKALRGGRDTASNNARNGDVAESSKEAEKDSQVPTSETESRPPRSPLKARSKTWKTLTSVKERIKRLHRQINWLTMVDVAAVNTTVHFLDVGQIQVGTLTMSVDTRRKMVDSGRLFRHSKHPSGEQKPAEWIFNVKNILLALDGRESVELLDNLQLNINGILYKELEGLRDASVAVKVGRLHVPYDDLKLLSTGIKGPARQQKSSRAIESDEEVSLADIFEELDKPGSREETIVQTVADSKEFVSSILRGIQGFQLALSFLRLSREVQVTPQNQNALFINFVSHEVGVDLHRMDPKSPAHRMYFQRDDVAHQALLAAISVSVNLDNKKGDSDRILYIPMATTTIKTTLPSKTVSFAVDQGAAERNSNVLFANVVVTSPAVDLETRQLSQLLAMFRARAPPPRGKSRTNHQIISRLLPKASIKLSIHEPVVRFILPTKKDFKVEQDDYNLLISSISSISLDIESSYAADDALRYSLSSVYRVVSHQLYYQTNDGGKHDILFTESMELKAQLNAAAELQVVVSGYLNTFSIHMTSGDVTTGIHQIIDQFRSRAQPTRLSTTSDTPHPSILRRLPSWLQRIQFEATGSSLEIAGKDLGGSNLTRGVTLQLQSWTADYRAQKVDYSQKPSRRRTTSYSVVGGEESPFMFPTSPPRKAHHGPADGRRLAIHVKGLEGFIIESEDYLETESFLLLPRFEVALSTSSDLQGPIFHINSHVRALYLQYSLFRYYSLGIAVSVLKDAFLPNVPESQPTSPGVSGLANVSLGGDSLHVPRLSVAAKKELITVDVKASLIQVKAVLPADPRMMLQIYGLAAGRHRWSAPFVRSQLVRFHAEAPKAKGSWARLISMNNIRVDLRESKRKHGRTIVEERSVDVFADFIRLGVPHQMIMHRIFDNIANTTKAVEQLHHQFKTRSNEYVLNKAPKGPKRVPRISLRSKALFFELEDDAFEWKLSTIYRLGLLEQRQRLAREAAYHMKIAKVEEQERRAPSRLRPYTAHGHLRRPSGDSGQTKMDDAEKERRPVSRGRRNRKLRYDPEGTCNFSTTTKLSADAAWNTLQLHNARSWKQRIDKAIRFQSSAIKEIRSLFAGADGPPDDVEDDENILAIPSRPGLMSALISDIHLVIDKPSFPLNEYAIFLHKIGKGMPLDMQYSLLLPMSIKLDMGEARVNMRDYPLDLLHIPALRPGQSPRLPSWSLRTDFVIAEEFRDYHSARSVKVAVVPPATHLDGTSHPGFAIDVRRTVAPVKTYSDMAIDVNTSLPTRVSWGMSYQPVIQDMMKIFEGFTKPELDPSERVGFWDKIRLSFHSRLNVNWKGDGDVHLCLKGSRDPYVITGFGAGFIMCWRKDVQLQIHATDDPRRFMTVTSGEYVLAVPDFSHQARHSAETPMNEIESVSTGSSSRQELLFNKVIMKLSGSVRWTAGLVFERNVDGQNRSFDFKPHYEVVLKNPRFIGEDERKNYDAFKGFRSNHIHLSVAVAAPTTRDWSATNLTPSASYNSVHLTPKFFTHFFDWWSLFSGVMSLPIRQGPLWPGLTKSSKKFSRHLATVKYNVLFSPLFLAHIYKHKDAEDYAEETVSATGIKVRLDGFMLDLHQRREQVNTQMKGRGKQTKTSTMKIYSAQLDLIAADFRAVSANIGGTNPADIDKATDDILSSFQQPPASVDLSQFTIPDQDLNWIDMDDFVELDWILPSESNPRTHILPLAYAPRFTYFRQTDHGKAQPDDTGFSPFGEEETHFCVMSQDNDPRRVQMELVRDRLSAIDAQIEAHRRTIGEQELRVIREGNEDEALKAQYETYVEQGESLHKRRDFLSAGLSRLERQLCREQGDRESTGPESQTESPESEHASEKSRYFDQKDPEIDGLFASPNDEFASDFNNRFIIHNIQLKWNNSLRNIVLRYSHQVNQRRGFVYYMSRRAVKFILDIVQEQGKFNRRPSHSFKRSSVSGPSGGGHPEDSDDAEEVEDRIEQLLNDAKRFVDADDPRAGESRPRPRSGDFSEKIAPEFTPQNSYHLRLIAPQIQLQSEKNKKSVVLVTAKGMQLKVVSIMDKHRVSDDVSGLVQRRFSLEMDGAQFFVTCQDSVMKFIHLYSGNKYGNTPGSAWPPWLSLEAMFDFNYNPFGFSRIIQKTSASLRFDKYNTLRLKYNEEVAHGQDGEAADLIGNENRIDQIWVDFPHVRAVCDSTEYYAMYIIVLDLLLYSEPLEKVRSERLEKIMLASDFSDLRGTPEMVSKLQERIRQLQEIKHHFQIQAKHLDKQGWKDRMAVERDLASSEDELFFIMKAITTSQRKVDDRGKSEPNGLMRFYISASEVMWHLTKDATQPLVEFQLRNAAFERTDNSDGSNNNCIEVERIYGLNLLPDALYPQMIVPYLDQSRRAKDTETENMLQVKWFSLEAIAGIPVLDNFEVTLFPLKVQLERELGHELFEYIFPGVGSNAFENGGFSPFVIKNMHPLDDDDDEDSKEGSVANLSMQSTGSSSADDSKSSGPGAIGVRLKPTYTLSDQRRSRSPARRPKNLVMTPLTKDNVKDQSQSRLHPPLDRPRSASRPSSSLGPAKKTSYDSLRMIARQNTDKSVLMSSETTNPEETRRRYGLSRAKNKRGRSDDISQMMSRASNYMTLAHVKINDVVLCLSYKGKGERNIEDVHDFVFRLPVLEYHNKIWSNLDLALRLKKDVIKALISHTPAILGNKFSAHRPTKQRQKHLRDLAPSSQTLPSTPSMANTPSIMESTYSRSSNSERSESPPPRRSFNSTSSPLGRSNSIGSSLQDVTSQLDIVVDNRPRTSASTGPRPEDNGSIHSSMSGRMTEFRPVSRSSGFTTGEGNKMSSVRDFGRKFLGLNHSGSKSSES